MEQRTHNEAGLSRINLQMDVRESAAVDEFRFARRFASKSSAIRHLIRKGLTAEGVQINAEAQT